LLPNHREEVHGVEVVPSHVRRARS
jgi:hypothetical protein